MLKRLAVGAVFFGLACASPERESPAPDLSIVRAQIDSLWTKYSTAVVAGDADAIARLYADSAYVVESGLPTVRGESALRSVLKEVLSGVNFFESKIRPETTEIAGDRVLQFGAYRDVLQSTGKPVEVVVGRYAAVLRRDSTSAWRVSHLIAVADSSVPQQANTK